MFSKIQLKFTFSIYLTIKYSVRENYGKNQYLNLALSEIYFVTLYFECGRQLILLQNVSIKHQISNIWKLNEFAQNMWPAGRVIVFEYPFVVFISAHYEIQQKILIRNSEIWRMPTMLCCLIGESWNFWWFIAFRKSMNDFVKHDH